MKLLVVEDHDKVAQFIVKGLREERYTVDLAVNGDNGLSLAQTGAYDLIILDLMLPGKSGYTVAETLRKGGIKTPIIMLTARDQVQDKVRCLDVGADDYLSKPFAFEELLARIRALLRRGELVFSNRLTVADLVMDVIQHEVYRGGAKIELTVKEYGLLEYLLRNKGRIVTRTAIIEHVWDIHFDSDTNLVDVYIRYLRKKIDDNFTPKLIHTIRGIGYVLKEET